MRLALRRRLGGAILPSIHWLFALALACTFAVLGLETVFEGLRDELRAKSRNEQARLFVGDEILRGIDSVEKSMYQMVSATSVPGLARVRGDIDENLAKLHNDIGVLENGGRVERSLPLNIGEIDNIVHAVDYVAEKGGERYVMELIEISPLLEQIPDKAQELEALILRRGDCVERGDNNCLFRVQPEIAFFLKQLPPYFERINENANRLFYDSYQRLNELEGQLEERRAWLGKIKLVLVGLVVIFAGLFAVLFARRLQQANDQLTAAVEAMRSAKEEAERASRTKSEFVSRMSHELRTPLNAIIGFAELLEDEPLDPVHRNYVGLINSSGKHLMELINAVLDHAKIEAGGLVLEQIPYDLPAAIESVRSMMSDRAKEKGLEFVASIASDLPRFVSGDPTRLRQVLINLLGNAVKFTERGSIELRVAQDDGRLVFSVRDTGIGMDADTLKRLFNPFSQADSSITRKFGGTGLGLLIARELIEGMGGGIEVESAPGTGSAFWFWLPLRIAAAPADAQTTGKPSAGKIALPGKVLVVDDNEVNRKLATAMLDRLGLAHECAGDGKAALDRLGGGGVALVLMDVEMPEMDGITATRQLRTTEAAQARARLPVVAMTANAMQDDREACLAAGMDGYLAKPLSMSALEGELQRLFGGKLIAGIPEEKGNAMVPVGELFDRAVAVERMGDDALFDELAKMFVSRAQVYLAEIDASLAAGDAPTLARAAHTLKGLCATFAAAPSEAAALQLEQAAKHGDLAACPVLVAAVRRQTEALAAALAA
jgi:signal transduction histidine kinase/CheY-like chemotaxis protein